MEEILCPMCGNPNHGEAEECVHCGARLKPLEVGDSADDSEDWLDRIRGETGEAASFSDVGGEEPDFNAAQGDDDFEIDFDQLRAAEGAPPPDPAAEEPQEEEIPEWLQRIREKQAEEPAGEPAPAEPELDEAMRAADLHAASDETDLTPEATPPTESGPADDFEPTPEAAVPPESGPADDPEAPADPEAESLDIPESTPEEEPKTPAESPEWLSEAEEPSAEPEDALPHVPALIGGEADAADAELGDLGLPDWLGEIEPATEDEEEEPSDAVPGEGPDLAPATLPNWLEAMRPVDTFRSVVEIESEDDQAVESVGPLAGLSGVLLAEPVVAMPRTSSVGSMQLDVSERQYAQAELLHQIVDEEESETPSKPKVRARLAIFRWAIAAIILAAVSLPIVTGTPSFALPSLEPRELGSLFDRIERLPQEKPLLVVFDYEAGYSGELEAVSGALLDHIMNRDLAVASLSTRPNGSALALRAFAPFMERYAYQNGEDIIHLGYLSGGSTAVQLFAVSPRDTVLEGFALPEEVQDADLSVWETPVLEQVQALSDFGMVIVIAADSETARLWAEQARPNLGDSTLVAVLSAGAEPLVRPYFESEDPKVGGILAGLPAAAAYELRNGRLGLAQVHWDAFGTAMLAAEIVLFAGTGYGLFLWWRGRSQV